ncbi:MAG: asparaginase [Firmicutes bacterium]|nr:asparaginase [Bacillota bacterium]
MEQKKPKVLLLATGGTIAGKGAPGKTTNYRPGEISVEELIETVPGLGDLAEIKSVQFANVASIALTHQDWLNLANLINSEFSADPELRGVVVTHGTDVLEETAYFLHLSIKDIRPVVVVGSMRPATALSADGPLNLLNAVKIAVSQEAEGKGVLVALNDEIHCARDVTKGNANKVETFQSPYCGPLGFVKGDNIHFYHQPSRLHTYQTVFDTSGLKDLPRVDLAYSHIMADGAAIEAYVERGAKGIVIAAAGAGAVTREMSQAMEKATQAGVVILLGTRCGAGLVGPARQEMLKRGYITADNLNPQKARVLLALALAHTDNLETIQDWFNNC